MDLKILSIMALRLMGLCFCLSGIELLITALAWPAAGAGVFLFSAIVRVLAGALFVYEPTAVSKYLKLGTGEGPAVPSASTLRVTFALFALVLMSDAIAALAQDLVRAELSGKSMLLFGGALALFFGVRGVARMSDFVKQFAVEGDEPADVRRAEEVSLLAFGGSLYGMFLVVANLGYLAEVPALFEHLWSREESILDKLNSASGSPAWGSPLSLWTLSHVAPLIFGVVLLFTSGRIARFWAWLHADRAPHSP